MGREAVAIILEAQNDLEPGTLHRRSAPGPVQAGPTESR